MKKKWKVALYSIGGVVGLLALLRLALPCPINGAWRGNDIQCMCESHNFLLFRDGHGVYCVGGHTNQPALSCPIVQIGRNTWKWEYFGTRVDMTNFTWTARTNEFWTFRPGWLFMRGSLPGIEHTVWFHRDPRWRDAISLAGARKTMTLSEQMDALVDRIKKRKEPNKSQEDTDANAPDPQK